MGVQVKIRDKEFLQALQNATNEGLQRATVYCHGQAQMLVNKPNTGKRVKIKRPVKGGNKSSRTIYPTPSKPGEPPKKRTGFGQRNIVWEYDSAKMVGRYGITKNALYMFFLEIGTRFIAPRPWMLKALTNNIRVVVALLQSGKRKNGL